MLMAIFRRNPPSLSPPGGPTSSIPAASGPSAQKPVDPGRAAPEPLSIILPAVAALGSIASIAAVAWLAEDRTAERPKVKRRLDVILRDLETSCLGLAEILRRVIRHSPMFGLLGATSAAPLKFGLLGTRVDTQQGQIYIHLVNDVATMLVLATQASFDVTNAIEDGDLMPPEALIYKFGDAQAKLTVLLASRESLKTTVETALAIAEGLVVCVRELKALRPGEART
jgi:hypothetical protein